MKKIVFFSKREWFLLESQYLEDVWTPTIYFSNAKEVNKLDSFGEKESLSSFWYKNENILHTNEVTFIALMCNDIKFNNFPFDQHECDIELRNWNGQIDRVEYNQLELGTVNALI